MGKKIPHRGRVQAQGGGTEKSEAWAQKEPPTEKDILRSCDRLEDRLTAPERKVRAEPFSELRRFIQSAARGGGVSAPVSKVILETRFEGHSRGSGNHQGKACVPDAKEGG